MKLTRRARTLAASSLLAVIGGCSLAGFAVEATASANVPFQAQVQCRIDFKASSLQLQTGKDLVLTWAAVGAEKLTASWTSAAMPFAGTVTTTMNTPGTFAYQVTGTSGGRYCGSGGIEVHFTTAAPANNVASHPAVHVVNNQPAKHAAAGTHKQAAGNGNAGVANVGKRAATSRNGHAGSGVDAIAAGVGKFPTQSPTGGSGVPWYRQPLNLLGIAGASIVASLGLLKREPIRATIVHRH
jgi:hypothetical protein